MKSVIKKFISSALAVCYIVLLSSTVGFAEESDAVVIFVSPDGNDSAIGSIEEPLKSLEGAKQKVRAYRKDNKYPKNGIKVVLRGGSYYWTKDVTFTQEDSGEDGSPLEISAYPGEVPIFEGGIKIPGRELEKVRDDSILKKISGVDAKRNLYSINLSKYAKKKGFGDYDFKALNTGADYFNFWGSASYEKEEIMTSKQSIFAFDNSEALWPARYPNKECEDYEDSSPSDRYLITTGIVSNGTNGTVFGYNDPVIKKYINKEDVYCYSMSYYRHEWSAVEVINSSQISSKHKLDYVDKFFLYNILEELDSPGEYYIDKSTGDFYVYPNVENVEESNLNIPLYSGDYMITINNAENITFNGIVIENSKGSGVLVDGGKNISFKNCTFENFGVHAADIGIKHDRAWAVGGNPIPKWGMNYIDITDDAVKEREGNYESYPEDSWVYWQSVDPDVFGYNSGLDSCYVANTGGESISMVGGICWQGVKANHYVTNSRLYYSSLAVATYAGSIRCDGNGFVVRNNEIAHSQHSAMGGWGTLSDFICDKNDIHDCMKASEDMGMIYINYGSPNWGLEFTNNYWHDVPYDVEIVNKDSAKGMRSAIYLDNGSFGAGTKITGNIFANIPNSVINTKLNTDYSNNLYVDCFVSLPDHGIAMEQWMKLEDFANREEHNDLHPEYLNLAYSPWFANDKKVQNEFKSFMKENYPEFWEMMDIFENYKNPEAKFYAKVSNNLILNKNMIKSSQNINYNVYDMYSGGDVTYCEGHDNNYIDDISVVEDYKNKVFNLTDEARKEYSCNPVNLSEVGPQTDFVGAYENAQNLENKLPQGNIGIQTETLANISVPESFGNCVIMKVGSSLGVVGGNLTYLDSQNPEGIKPIIMDSKTMVPLRIISENFSASVNWDELSRTITIKNGSHNIVVMIDINKLLVDNKVARIMQVPPIIRNSRTLIPLRDFCEAGLQKNVYWRDDGLIIISDEEIDINANRGILNKISSVLK